MFDIKKNAFTLSEVLIALTIIGVVAAITVPRVMTGTNTKANVIKLKRAYTSIEEALRIASARNNYNMADITNLAAGDTSHPYNAQSLLSGAFDAKALSTTHSARGSGLSYNSTTGKPNTTLDSYNANTSIARSNDLSYQGRNGAFYSILFKTSTGNSGDVPNGCTSDAPCILYIDINGRNNGPNEIITCTSRSDVVGSFATDSGGFYTEPDACEVDDSVITDIYQFFIYDGEVKPATSATVAVLEK